MKLLLFITIIPIVVFSTEHPKWIDETPQGYKNNYFVGYASSPKSETDAREKALFNAIASVVRNANTIANVNQTMLRQQNEQSKNGESVNLDEVTRITTEVVVKGESQTIIGLKEEEHYTEYSNGAYTVYALVKVPKPTPLQTNPPTKSDYFVRSFIPGWSQYFKGQSTKGFLFASGEVVLITSGVIFAGLKTDRENQISPLYSQAVNNDYQNQANTFSNLSIISFVGAGALYIYNIIDGISSEEKVYVENVAIKPAIFAVSKQTAAGINISISF